MIIKYFDEYYETRTDLLSTILLEKKVYRHMDSTEFDLVQQKVENMFYYSVELTELLYEKGVLTKRDIERLLGKDIESIELDIS